MPTHKFETPSEPLFEVLKGVYPFEVVAYDSALQSGTGVTKGSETVELKVKFFKDETFDTPLAQWTETLIFHEKTGWKIDTFIAAAGIMIDGRLAVPGKDAVDFSEEVCIGLRGWAKCEPEPGTTDKTKLYNRVKQWLIDKPKLAKKGATQEPADDPGTPVPEDNISFD